MIITLRYASILRTDFGCTTFFKDGAFVNSAPHDSHHYHVVAHRCGYQDDTMAYCIEHDFFHSFLSEYLFDKPSGVLWSVAHGEDVLSGVAAIEEFAVQGCQRWLRTNERPIIADVDWDGLKADAIARLDGAAGPTSRSVLCAGE